MRDVIVYSVLRLGLWALLWWILFELGVGFYLAGILAVLIAFLVSAVLLRKPRDKAAGRLQQADEHRRARKGPKHDRDAEEEDFLLGGPSQAPGSNDEPDQKQQ
jgi:sugar phosphate permease